MSGCTTATVRRCGRCAATWHHEATCPLRATPAPPIVFCARCPHTTTAHDWRDDRGRRICGACASAMPSPEREVML